MLPSTNDASYRGEACQHLNLDLVDLEVKGHSVLGGYNQKCGATVDPTALSAVLPDLRDL